MLCWRSLGYGEAPCFSFPLLWDSGPRNLLPGGLGWKCPRRISRFSGQRYDILLPKEGGMETPWISVKLEFPEKRRESLRAGVRPRGPLEENKFVPLSLGRNSFGTPNF